MIRVLLFSEYILLEMVLSMYFSGVFVTIFTFNSLIIQFDRLIGTCTIMFCEYFDS